MQCGAVQCGAVQCGAVRCGAVQCSAVQCSAVKRHYLENYNGYMMNYIGNGSIRACRAAKMTLSVYSLPM